MAQEDKSAREVLRMVPSVLRALVEDKEKLAAALAEYKQRDKAEEIVAMMETRGLGDASVPFKKRVSDVLSSEKDLDVIKEAVALAAPDMSFASISERPEIDSGSSFENFILNGQA
jgi:hypothetical protein